MSNKEFMQGNQALAEAAIRSGCLFYYGYPITPSSEIPEYYASQKDRGITFVQAESEVAAFNMLAGTAATGRRVMTATSGPGFSLGQEAMSYMSAAQLPVVVVNVMRPGPADGEIMGAQGDYFQATRGGGHGDYYVPVLAPYSVQEQVDHIRLAFELADKYRTPVILLSDGKLAKMRESVELPEPLKLTGLSFADAIGQNNGQQHFINTCGDGIADWESKVLKLLEKFEVMRQNEQRWESVHTEDAEIIIVSYGITARVAETVVEMAREDGIALGLIRPISLWPFPEKAFCGLKAKEYLAVELSAGQMVEDVKLSVPDKSKVRFYGRVGGFVPTPEELYEHIRKEYGL